MADLKEARVPDIGGHSDVPVIEVLVAVGDTVAKDQGLVTLESDKATMEVPAPFAGVVRELKVKVGDTLSEGGLVALIEPSEAAPAADGCNQAPQRRLSEPAAKVEASPGARSSMPAKRRRYRTGRRQPAKPAPSPASCANGPVPPPVRFDADAVLPEKVPYASPAVRLFARELGVDLAQVSGSERGGRIGKEDVQRLREVRLSAGRRRLPRGRPVAAAWTCCPGRRSTSPSSARSKRSRCQPHPEDCPGANLARNWAMIPHVTQHDDADITELEALRVALNSGEPEDIAAGMAPSSPCWPS